jgi:hypothetical protein
MAKLTLSVDSGVVKRAKRYASLRGTSISRLVERYLSLLSRREPAPADEDTPVLARLRGTLKGAADELSYKRHLERKYR